MCRLIEVSSMPPCKVKDALTCCKYRNIYSIKQTWHMATSMICDKKQVMKERPRIVYDPLMRAMYTHSTVGEEGCSQP